MGMFDDVLCDYPLPWPEAQGQWFQSKCTDAQYLEKYCIRENGELWHRVVELQFQESSEAPLGFYLVETKAEWVREAPTGEIEIHAWQSVGEVNYWYSVRFWFRDGLVADAVFEKSDRESQTNRAQPWSDQPRRPDDLPAPASQAPAPVKGER